MGLFDLINPLSPIKLTKKILDSDDMDLEEFGEKLLSKPYRPGGILINAIDLIEPEENRKAVYGDVIGVKRKMGYKHFGVYVGKGKVIHYASTTGDFGGNICIHETTLNNFLGEDDEYFILEFPSVYGSPKEVNTKLSDKIVNDLLNIRPSMRKVLRFLKNSSEYHLYSPKETVRRARSRLGESSYNLATNNCEHFAIWCKTGISESHQVNALLGG